MRSALESLDGSHIFYALGIGILAGVIWYAIDVYAISRVETAIGVTPGNL